MRPTTVFSIELTDQDLTDLPDPRTITHRATHAVSAQAPAANDYDLIEIELTAEEMDDLLSER